MRERLTSIDALRGVVMVVMALDHVRDFIHAAAMTGASPTDLATTTPALFFTRWITHFCAPLFMLTAGLGAFFWWHGRRTRGELSRFLATRGAWLILLELTVMRVAYNFDVTLRDPILLIVLWVLGACMIGLAALVWLPPRWLAVVSVAGIALHNLLDPIRARQLGAFAPVWNLLHQVGAFQLDGLLVIVGYPMVPWVFTMAAGFCLGPVFLREQADRQRTLARLGLILTAGFVALRLVNGYGDPSPWSTQPSAVFTLLSFLNTTKYPPSLDFLLMTLGPGLLLLAWLESRAPARSNPLVVFGRVPLFYFVAHFYLAHLAAAALAFDTYGPSAWSFLFHPVPSMGGPADLFPPGFGHPLWAAYFVWFLVVCALYPACRWFGALKERHRGAEWVSYF